MSPDNPNMKIVPERDEPAPMRPGSSGRSSGGNGLLWLMIALLVAAVAAVYFHSRQLSDQLEQQSGLIGEYAQRIQVLEDELTATGRDLSRSGDTLEKRIEDSEHEIRKLWDLSNKRNKVDIARNEKALTDLEQSLSGLAEELKTQQAALTDEAAIRENMDQALKTEQQVFSTRLTEQKQSLQQAETTLADLKTQQNKIRQDLESLKNKKEAGVDPQQLQAINKTLALHEERLNAIDAARRQLTGSVIRLNTDVNRLQLQVNAISAEGETAGTP